MCSGLAAGAGVLCSLKMPRAALNQPRDTNLVRSLGLDTALTPTPPLAMEGTKVAFDKPEYLERWSRHPTLLRAMRWELARRDPGSAQDPQLGCQAGSAYWKRPETDGWPGTGGCGRRK
ncbi:hypothetical protein B0H13DRAFT_1896159 [Mycena leptocephala]|nr:hypothetical protein B0H13DRAFT_1896159 [Mycena leptocephala]